MGMLIRWAVQEAVLNDNLKVYSDEKESGNNLP